MSVRRRRRCRPATRVRSAAAFIQQCGAGSFAPARCVTAGIDHGAFEAEQLGCGYPWLPFLDTLPLLEELLEAQRRAGRTLFLISATTETDEELEALLHTIHSEPVLVVALRAKPATAASRVLQREPTQWEGRGALARNAQRLAPAIPALRRVDAIVDTDNLGLRDAAASVYRLMIAAGVLPRRTQ